MKPREIYQLWAPRASPWSPWVKPVLLASLAEPGAPEGPPPPAVAGLPWAPPADGASIVVCDLPGPLSVAVGLALAVGRGFRPVPLFNALPVPPEDRWKALPAVDVWPIVGALAACAPLLGALGLADDAPPVFLLDSLRGTGRVHAEGFDNRSVSLPTDFPSATVLLSRGVRQALLVQPEGVAIQADLAHTLRRWQEAGVAILIVAPEQTGPPLPLEVPRPALFRLLWYSLLATMGLRRAPLGGFGGFLPTDSAGG
jgi:hypothetical protein